MNSSMQRVDCERQINSKQERAGLKPALFLLFLHFPSFNRPLLA